jgi:hypothetical protein
MGLKQNAASLGAGACVLSARRHQVWWPTTSRLTALFHRIHEASDLGAGVPTQLGGSYWEDRCDLPAGTDLAPGKWMTQKAYHVYQNLICRRGE